MSGIRQKHINSHIGQKGESTAKQLMRVSGGARSHECDFSHILPSAMASLVADGLFEPIGRDGRGKMHYRITAKGMQKLQEMDLQP